MPAETDPPILLKEQRRKRSKVVRITSDKTKEVLQIIFFFLLSIGCQRVLNPDSQVFYDSDNYVQLSQSFWKEGSFSLLNFTEGIRGVWFPLILAPFIRISREWGWRILSALMTVFFVCYFPQIILGFRGKGDKYLFGKRLILFLLLFCFWSGIFLYPLSDGVALVFLVLGIRFIFKNKIGSYLIGGVFFYLSYNIRTIYLLPVLFFIIGHGVLGMIHKKYSQCLIFLVSVGMGLLIIAPIPQIIVNLNRYNILSLKVMTEEGYSSGLFSWQLAEGLRHSEYETHIGSMNVYPMPGIRFSDRVGENILLKEGLNPGEMSMGDVVKVIIKYPFEVMGIYMRHLINMLNPVWGEGYIKDIHKTKIYLSIINYCLMFTAVCYGVLKISRGKQISLSAKQFMGEKGERCLLWSTILIPCIGILPGCVEQRFFFGAYMLMYIFLLFSMGKDGFLNLSMHWKKRPMYYAALFIIGFALLSAVWGNTYANTEHGIWISLW